MLIEVFRRYEEKEKFNGLTFGEFYIDGKKNCETLEDEGREVKVFGETRIPAGEYDVELKPSSRFDANYIKRFGKSFHKGMLWIKNVPGFEGILIHIGNKEKDTMGCILVGMVKSYTTGEILESTKAYKKIYEVISKALLNKEKVRIKIIDIKK